MSLASWLAPRPAGSAPLVSLGTMNFGRRTPAAEARAIIDRAIERGVRLLDTANIYNGGESERIVGQAIAGRRDQVLVATKVGLDRRGDRRGKKPEGLSRASVLAALDASLQRLGTDHVDLYYLHAPDPETPLDETIEVVAELLRSGKIRHLGLSNFASWQVLDIQHLCRGLGVEGPLVSQVLYNALVRQIEIEHLAFARAHGVHVTVYNALAGGLLTGKHRPDAPAEPGSRFDTNVVYRKRYWSARFFELVEAFGVEAREAGVSLADLSYQWLAARPGVDSILVGPATVAQLDQALDACARPLDAAVVGRLDALYRDFQGTDAAYAR
jgi:aryl-alcohol dehydrogenase-like predicted oxidoreductase